MGSRHKTKKRLNLQCFLSNRWFGRTLLILLICGMFFLILKNPNQFIILLKINIIELATLLGINLLFFLITSTTSWYLLSALGASIPWSTNMAITFLANFLNYFGPAQPGTGAKAMYLKIAHNIRYTDFAIMTGTNALIMLLVSGLMGCTVVGWKWFAEGLYLTELGSLSLMMTLSVLILPLVWRFLPRFRNNQRKWIQAIGNTIDGIARLWADRGAIVAAVGLVAAQYMVAGIVLWLSYRVIGFHIEYSIALLISAFLSVANIVPLTPNNIGVFELVMGAATHLSGADFSTGLIAAGIMRIFHLTICVLAVPYANWQLRRL